MDNSRILPILCTEPGCGFQLGTYTLPEYTDPTGITLADMDIVDAKCDEHRTTPE